MSNSQLYDGAVLALSNEQLVDVATVMVMFNVRSAMTIYRWEKDPQMGFPKRIRLGPRMVRWRLRELLEFRDRRSRGPAPNPELANYRKRKPAGDGPTADRSNSEDR